MKCVLLALVSTIVFACAGSVHAQDLSPELAAPQARHQAQVKALDVEKSLATTKSKQRYLDELSRTEKLSTASGKLGEVAAILKEREAVESGAMGPLAAEELPKALARSRTEFIASLEALARQFQPRYDKANADYLRSLAALDSQSRNKPELQKQIAAEKAKLVNQPSATGVRELTDAFLANSQWNWIPKSPTGGVNDWQFLADGTISTGAGHFGVGKRSGADQFEIRDGAKLLMSFKMNFAKMEAEDVTPDNRTKGVTAIEIRRPNSKRERTQTGTVGNIAFFCFPHLTEVPARCRRR